MNATAEQHHPLADPECKLGCEGSGYVVLECFDQVTAEIYTRVEVCSCVLEKEHEAAPG